MLNRQDAIPTVIVCALLLAAATPALADPKEIGRFGDWTAFVDGSDAKKTCFVGSSPKKTEGTYKARGQTYLLVTHRPAEKAFGEVSVEAGYTYKPGSEVVAEVDAKAYKLFTQGGNAWAQNEQADKALVQVLRSGKQLVVKGTSSRGTATTDTYALSGFGSAYDAINKACAVN